MGASVDFSVTNLVLLCAIVFGVKKLIKVLQKWNLERVMKKWDNAPTGKVILHTLWRCKTLPSASPFALKLETYLRMAKIPYEIDTKDLMGPKGKLPWFSYNGNHVGDSHLGIQFLNKKFSINLNSKASEEQVAIAKACRIVLEEHFFWGLVQFRMNSVPSCVPKVMNLPTIWKLFMPIQRYLMNKRLVGQGMGVHTPAEIYEMTEDGLKVVSKILGNKKFIAGSEPIEEDAAVFAALAQACWALPGSGFETLANGELSNLKEYCERMKQLYWPDWEQCLDRS